MVERIAACSPGVVTPYVVNDALMGPTACAAVRHSCWLEASAQEKDFGAIETSWDSLRVATGRPSTVGKASAVKMSSASAGVTRCENMALALVPALVLEL